MKTMNDLWKMYKTSAGLDKLPKGARLYAYIFGASIATATLTLGSGLMVVALVSALAAYMRIKKFNKISE